MNFRHFLENLEINIGKKLITTATKTWIDAAKTASKRVVQKTPEATGDRIGNKVADKITSAGKAECKEGERKQVYIPQEKKTANYWWFKFVLIPYKNGISHCESYKMLLKAGDVDVANDA